MNLGEFVVNYGQQFNPNLIMKTNLMTALIMLMGMIQGYGVVTLGNSSNTNPPAGNRGWDTQGTWCLAAGTVVDKRWFITATHAGGEIGNKFILDGIEYTTIAKTNHPNPLMDCTMWKVNSDIPASYIAVMCTNTDLVGKPITLFGRGISRGAPIYRRPLVLSDFIKGNCDEFKVMGDAGTSFKVECSTNLIDWTAMPAAYVVQPCGWTNIVIEGSTNSRMFYRAAAFDTLIGWGMGDYTGNLTWGTNVIASTDGGLISFTFDRNGGPDEGCFTFYDSGSGGFAEDAGQWKLAGINRGSPLGPFSSNGQDEFYGTMLDCSGLSWEGALFPTDQGVFPGVSYCTPLPVDWIKAVIKKK